jgi:aspartyl-tRNA(Asn)/glutamyl-tRNA(Gln) amidotransferase subunit C
MKITQQDVLHVAKLARLEIEEAAVDRFADQIATILNYVDTLNKVDTDGIQPTSHAIFRANAFREDEPAGHLARELALANAPDQEEGAFLVPKVIE